MEACAAFSSSPSFVFPAIDPSLNLDKSAWLGHNTDKVDDVASFLYILGALALALTFTCWVLSSQSSHSSGHRLYLRDLLFIIYIGF